MAMEFAAAARGGERPPGPTSVKENSPFMQEMSPWSRLGKEIDCVRHRKRITAKSADGTVPLHEVGAVVALMSRQELALPEMVMLIEKLLVTARAAGAAERLEEFVSHGGVRELARWLKNTVSAGCNEELERKLVVGCLQLLHKVPMTIACMQDTKMARILAVIHKFCPFATKVTAALASHWKDVVCREAGTAVPKQPKATTSVLEVPVLHAVLLNAKEVSTNWYEVLAVPCTATQTQIKQAFRKKLRTHHPDKVKKTVARTAALDAFHKLVCAYRALADSPHTPQQAHQSRERAKEPAQQAEPRQKCAPAPKQHLHRSKRQAPGSVRASSSSSSSSSMSSSSSSSSSSSASASPTTTSSAIDVDELPSPVPASGGAAGAEAPSGAEESSLVPEAPIAWVEPTTALPEPPQRVPEQGPPPATVPVGDALSRFKRKRNRSAPLDAASAANADIQETLNQLELLGNVLEMGNPDTLWEI